MENHHNSRLLAENATEYNRIAWSYLVRPPNPELTPLALAFFRKSLELEPDNLRTHLGMASAYHLLGKIEEALACCEKALSIKPDSIEAMLCRCMMQIPILYNRPEDVAISRRNYRRHLEQLMRTVDAASSRDLALAAGAIGVKSPFFLPYQGYNVRDLQRIYGNLVHKVLAARYPHWSEAPRTPPPGPRERVRVGFVFGFFQEHSAWKVLVKGWVSRLDQNRFWLAGYSLGTVQDEETEYARGCLAKFVEGPMPFQSWCRTISRDRPHVLIYPEIGMHRQTLKLAALRLAPVQCASWGHFVTSGLPTMDYFISGEEVEPPGAEACYTEKLVRLPGLSIHYLPPQVTLEPLRREDFGLRPSSVVYFCPQSLFKYLPQFDAIFPRIAARVKDCQFVFMKHKTSEAVTRQFDERLAAAFADQGLHKGDCVVLTPTLSRGAYHTLNSISDVFLDSLDTSGVTTTLEAIDHGLPIVTRPGQFLRGYVGAALLRRMGVPDTIARDLDDYVDLAVRLGNDADWRRQIAERMSQNKHKLYGDTECIEGLESFLEAVARGNPS